MASSFFKDAMKDSFKESRIPKTAYITLTLRGEMRDGLTEVISNKPTICDIGFNFFHGLGAWSEYQKGIE